LVTGHSKQINVPKFNIEHNAIVRLSADGKEELVQYLGNSGSDMKYDFYFKGNNIKTNVYS
jgi:hypothetical protein